MDGGREREKEGAVVTGRKYAWWAQIKLAGV